MNIMNRIISITIMMSIPILFISIIHIFLLYIIYVSIINEQDCYYHYS